MKVQLLEGCVDFNRKVSKKIDKALAYEQNRQKFKQLIAMVLINELVLDNCRMTVCGHTNKYIVEGTADILDLFDNKYMVDKAIMYGRIKAHNAQYEIDILYYCDSVENSTVHISVNDGSLELNCENVNDVLERFSKPGSLDKYIDFCLRQNMSKRYPRDYILDVSINIHINSNICDFGSDYRSFDDDEEEMDRKREKWLF